MGEQFGDAGLRFGHDPQAQLGDALLPAHREDDVHAFDGGHFGEQTAATAPEAFALHPHFQRAPEGKGEEADLDVRLHAVRGLVINRTQAEVAFGRAASAWVNCMYQRQSWAGSCSGQFVRRR